MTLIGRNIKAFGPDNVGYDTQVEIVELADVIPSHSTDNFARNPAYNQDLQLRERQNTRTQIHRIASKFVPELVMPSRDLESGAPILNDEGMVLSGNGRAMAISLILNRKHPRRQSYINTIREEMDLLGFSEDDKRQLDSFKSPVLIQRVLNASPFTQKRIARAGNLSRTSRYTAAESASGGAEALTKDTISALAVSDNDSSIDDVLNRQRNFQHILLMMEQIRGGNTDGDFNEDGTLRGESRALLTKALLAKAFERAENRDAVVAAWYDDDGTIENLGMMQKGIITSLPQLLKLRIAVEKGELDEDFDILPSIAKIARFYSTVYYHAPHAPREQRINEFMKTKAAFGNLDASHFNAKERALLRKLHNTNRSYLGIREFLTQYVNRSLAGTSSAQKGSMAGMLGGDVDIQTPEDAMIYAEEVALKRRPLLRQDYSIKESFKDRIYDATDAPLPDWDPNPPMLRVYADEITRRHAMESRHQADREKQQKAIERDIAAAAADREKLNAELANAKRNLDIARKTAETVRATEGLPPQFASSLDSLIAEVETHSRNAEDGQDATTAQAAVKFSRDLNNLEQLATNQGQAALAQRVLMFARSKYPAPPPEPATPEPDDPPGQTTQDAALIPQPPTQPPIDPYTQHNLQVAHNLSGWMLQQEALPKRESDSIKALHADIETQLANLQNTNDKDAVGQATALSNQLNDLDAIQRTDPRGIRSVAARILDVAIERHPPPTGMDELTPQKTDDDYTPPTNDEMKALAGRLGELATQVSTLAISTPKGKQSKAIDDYLLRVNQQISSLNALVDSEDRELVERTVRRAHETIREAEIAGPNLLLVATNNIGEAQQDTMMDIAPITKGSSMLTSQRGLGLTPQPNDLLMQQQQPEATKESAAPKQPADDDPNTVTIPRKQFDDLADKNWANGQMARATNNEDAVKQVDNEKQLLDRIQTHFADDSTQQASVHTVRCRTGYVDRHGPTAESTTSRKAPNAPVKAQKWKTPSASRSRHWTLKRSSTRTYAPTCNMARCRLRLQTPHRPPLGRRTKPNKRRRNPAHRRRTRTYTLDWRDLTQDQRMPREAAMQKAMVVAIKQRNWRQNRPRTTRTSSVAKRTCRRYESSSRQSEARCRATNPSDSTRRTLQDITGMNPGNETVWIDDLIKRADVTAGPTRDISTPEYADIHSATGSIDEAIRRAYQKRPRVPVG